VAGNWKELRNHEHWRENSSECQDRKHIDLHYSMIEAQDMFRKYDSDGTYNTVVIVLGRADHSSTNL
jgi:hypothetical protein